MANAEEYWVFYACAASKEYIDPDKAKRLPLAEIVTLAPQKLQADADFFGIIDDDGTCLQFSVEADGAVMCDIPRPRKKGSFQKRIAAGQLAATLKKLPRPLARLIDSYSFKAW